MQYQLKNQQLTIITESNGAELISVIGLENDQDINNGQGYQYLWQADPKYWNRSAPVLFPFVGRLKNDRYTFSGQTFFMPQHGFARDTEFEIVEHTDLKIIYKLVDNDSTRAVFPFKFELFVTYQLVDNELITKFLVVNKTDGPIYFSVGGHPGFNINFENDYLAIDPPKKYMKIPFNNGLVNPKGHTEFDAEVAIPISYKMFENDAEIIKNDAGELQIVLGDKNELHGVSLKADADFFGFWTPPGKNASFVAIEPWWGIADSIDANGRLVDKYAIRHLNQINQKFEAEYSTIFF